MRNQTISKTVIAVTAIVLVAATGLYLYSKKSGTREVPLKTYTNSTYRITFDYPETYALTETGVADNAGETGTLVTLVEKGTKIPKDGEGPTAITIGMFDNTAVKSVKEDPAEAWILRSTSSNFKLSKLDKPGETRVDGKDAWLYTWDGLYKGTSVVTEHDGNIIMFTVTYDGEMDLEKRKDFTDLMETVRFETATTSATSTANQ